MAGPASPAPTTVLVKGSRFMRLERVLAALAADPATDPTVAAMPPGHA